MIFLLKYWKEMLTSSQNTFALFFNNAITTSKFLVLLKMANVTPIFKKRSKNGKDNFRQVSILPVLSEIFWKLMSREISTFFVNILSKLQDGFRNGYSTQQCLLLMLEKWKLVVDNNEPFGALSTDLSKALLLLLILYFKLVGYK